MKNQVQCEGWWEQEGFGRQLMDQLVLTFDGQQVDGQGVDIVGLFMFSGTIDQNGVVKLVKQYIGQHTVDYVGMYDGEGTMRGEWSIYGVFRGEWRIKVVSRFLGFAAPDEIAEWPMKETPK